jgi:hypothetical protein
VTQQPFSKPRILDNHGEKLQTENMMNTPHLDKFFVSKQKIYRSALLAAFAIGMSPKPASAALFDNFTTFAKPKLASIATGFGIAGLQTFTDAFCDAIPTMIIIILCAWFIIQVYQGLQAMQREEMQAVFWHMLLGIGAILMAFFANAMVGLIVA